MAERFNGRVQREVLGITVASHRDLERLLVGFNSAYNARRQRVLDGRSPEQVVRERLEHDWQPHQPRLPADRLILASYPRPCWSSSAPRTSRNQTTRLRSQSCVGPWSRCRPAGVAAGVAWARVVRLPNEAQPGTVDPVGPEGPAARARPRMGRHAGERPNGGGRGSTRAPARARLRPGGRGPPPLGGEARPVPGAEPRPRRGRAGGDRRAVRRLVAPDVAQPRPRLLADPDPRGAGGRFPGPPVHDPARLRPRLVLPSALGQRLARPRARRPDPDRVRPLGGGATPSTTPPAATSTGAASATSAP